MVFINFSYVTLDYLKNVWYQKLIHQSVFVKKKVNYQHALCQQCWHRLSHGILLFYLFSEYKIVNCSEKWLYISCRTISRTSWLQYRSMFPTICQNLGHCDDDVVRLSTISTSIPFCWLSTRQTRRRWHPSQKRYHNKSVFFFVLWIFVPVLWISVLLLCTGYLFFCRLVDICNWISVLLLCTV